MCIIREVPLPDRTKDKAMKIGLYWILFLGQTIWSDHNPSLLLAGSVLVRDASAALQCTSWSRNSISIPT
jgi:hypothetical protein